MGGSYLQCVVVFCYFRVHGQNAIPVSTRRTLPMFHICTIEDWDSTRGSSYNIIAMPSVSGTVVGQNTNRCEGQACGTATAQLQQLSQLLPWLLVSARVLTCLQYSSCDK